MSNALNQVFISFFSFFFTCSGMNKYYLKLKAENFTDIMSFDVKAHENIVLSYITEYLNKNRYIEIKKIIPYIKSRVVKTDTNLNETGICKILKSLFQQNLIAEGSKFTKNKVLERPPLRRKIYDYIRGNPGVYYSRILKQFNIGRQSATWHLEMLIKFD